MSRNTHDRSLDHHGSDLDSNVDLDGATTNYTTGTDLHTVIVDMDDRIDEAAASGGGLVDLITGDDADFTTTVGNWTANGGTLTRDASYIIQGTTASLKWVHTTSGTDYISVPIAGTFEAGKPYVALVYLSMETDNITGFFAQYQVGIGQWGTESVYNPVYLYPNAGQAGVGNYNFQAVGVTWIPTANRTSVALRITAATNTVLTVHVGAARAWQTPTFGTHQVGSQWPSFPNYRGTAALNPWGNSYGVGFGSGGQASLMNSDGGGGVYLSAPASKTSYIWQDHPMGDKTLEGLDVQVGEDYIGLMIGQKDATTIQFYSDWDDWNFEFEDGADNGWKFVPADATTSAWPAKGMLPQYSTAPSTPVEGQSYYDTTDHKEYVWNGTTWVELGGGGFTSPLTTKGDLHTFDTDDARLPIGTDDYVLTADSTQATGMKWAAAASGFADPTTTKGDLIIHGASTTRLGVGTDGKVLTADSGTAEGVSWQTPSTGDPSPLTTKGDVYVFGTTDDRLPVGTNDHVLTADSTQALGVKWAAASEPTADAHISDTSDAHDASAISIVDTGDYFTSTDVEGALQEIGAGGIGGGATALDDLTDVNAPSPADGDALIWDDGAGEWVPGAVAASGAPAAAFIGAKVYGSTTSIGTSWTTLTFPAETFDTDGFHDTGSNTDRLTIPTGLGGKYLVQAHTMFTGGAAYRYDLTIALNGSTGDGEAFTRFYGHSDGYNAMGTSVVLNLAAGDYVTFKARNGSTNLSATQNWFSIVKLDSGKVGQGIGATAKAGTSTTSVTNATYTPVALPDTEEFDTDGFHDTATNNSRMTIPAGLGGKYLCTFTVDWDTNTSNERILAWGKNGSVVSHLVRQPAAAYLTQNGSVVLDLAAGDYIEMFVYQGSGGTRTVGGDGRTRLSVMRLDSGGGGMSNPMTATGDIIYSSDGSGTPARLATGTDGQVLTLASGVPSWATVSAGAGGSGNGILLGPAHDTYIDVQAPTSVGYTASEGMVGNMWGSSSYTRFMLMDFDTSSLSGMDIASARLYLYRTDASAAQATDRRLEARRVLRAFVDTEATWNEYSSGNSWTTAGARGVGTDIDTVRVMGDPVGAAADQYLWHTIDLTQLLIADLAEASTTLRIIISSNVNGNGSNFVKFGTMKYTAGYQPRIHIVPVGTAAAGATAEVSAAGRIFAYLNFR